MSALRQFLLKCLPPFMVRLIRQEILPSVDRSEDVDSEIRELFSALS